MGGAVSAHQVVPLARAEDGVRGPWPLRLRALIKSLPLHMHTCEARDNAHANTTQVPANSLKDEMTLKSNGPIPLYYKSLYEHLSKLLVHGQTMDDLGGSYRFTRIPSHVSARYRFALVKVRPSDSLILLVACPALYCPLLPFTALYCLLMSFTCPLMLFTAFYCPLRPFTALYCPLLPSTAWGSGS